MLQQEISVVLATGDEFLSPVVLEVPQVRIAGLVYLAEQVVEVVAEARPQILILVDFMDPGMETVKIVRHRYPCTRIIYIITDEAEERVRSVLIKLGIYDFLPPTFKKSELQKLLEIPRGWQDVCSTGLVLEDLISEPPMETQNSKEIQNSKETQNTKEIQNPLESPKPKVTKEALNSQIFNQSTEINKSAEDLSGEEGGTGFAAFLNSMVGGVGRNTTIPADHQSDQQSADQQSLAQLRQQVHAIPPERFATQPIKVIKQQVVAFWSGKPGVGKTFLAVNTALALARGGVKVALVDGDILNLSVGVFLNLQDVRKTLERALKVNHSGDIGEFLLYHPQYPNLAVITGSDLCRPEGYCNVNKEAVAQLIEYLKAEFDVVILDTSTDVQSVTTYVALQQANRVLLVTNQDYAQVFATKRQLALLKRLRQPLDKFQLVLNGELKGCKITSAMLEDIFGLKVVRVLPHLPKPVVDSIFESRPVVLQKGQEVAELREGIESLAQQIFPVLNEEKVSLLHNLSRLLRKKGSMTYGQC
ncbi:MAG: AAA family ATPase [Carboxydocellales bacterium]